MKAVREQLTVLQGGKADTEAKYEKFAWQDEDEEPFTKQMAQDHDKLFDMIGDIIEGYVSKRREMDR